MHRPEPRELVLLAIRRTFGVSFVLYVLYLAMHYLGGYPFLTPPDVLTILGLVFAGTWLGVAFSMIAPLPTSTGLPRVIRTALLVVPALGIGVALQIFIAGARSDMAIYAIFALAAWLGSTFIKEDEEEPDDASEYGLFDIIR